MTATIELRERKRGTRCCDPNLAPRLDLGEAQRLGDLFQALAHPIRLQILDMLSQSAEPVCVCDLEAALPVKQPTVSHHLKQLRDAGLIDSERQGLWAYYFVRPEALGDLQGKLQGLLPRE